MISETCNPMRPYNRNISNPSTTHWTPQDAELVTTSPFAQQSCPDYGSKSYIQPQRPRFQAAYTQRLLWETHRWPRIARVRPRYEMCLWWRMKLRSRVNNWGLSDKSRMGAKTMKAIRIRRKFVVVVNAYRGGHSANGGVNWGSEDRHCVPESFLGKSEDGI